MFRKVEYSWTASFMDSMDNMHFLGGLCILEATRFKASDHEVTINFATQVGPMTQESDKLSMHQWIFLLETT